MISTLFIWKRAKGRELIQQATYRRGPQVAQFILLWSLNCFKTLAPKTRGPSSMADMRKIEGTASPEKRKLDLLIPINETQEDEIKDDDESDSGKRHKGDVPAENEETIIFSLPCDRKLESKDVKEDDKDVWNDNKEENLKVEAESFDMGKRLSAADKGKAILIEESEEEEYYEEINDDSCAYYDRDFSDGFDSDQQDGPLY